MSEPVIVELPEAVVAGLFLLKKDEIAPVQITASGKHFFELSIYKPSGHNVIVEIWGEARSSAAYHYFMGLARQPHTKIFFAKASEVVVRKKLPYFILADLTDFQKNSNYEKYQKAENRIIIASGTKGDEPIFAQFTECKQREANQIESIHGVPVRPLPEWAYTVDEIRALSVPPPNLYDAMFADPTPNIDAATVETGHAQSKDATATGKGKRPLLSEAADNVANKKK